MPAPVDVRHPVAVVSAPTRRPAMDLVVGVAVVAFLALGTWCSYWAAQRNDQYQLIQLGQNVYHGGRMYIDAWENKPPGIAWINALGFVLTGGKQIGAWLLPGVVALGGVLTLWISAAKALTPTAGRRAALLAAILASIRLYDASSINPDFYAATFELAACAIWLVAVTTATGWGGAGLSVLAGLVWAMATSMKQTGCIGLMIVSVMAIFTAMTSFVDRRRWLAAAALAWLGFALGAATAGAVLYRTETHWAAWDAIFTFNRGLVNGDSLDAIVHSWVRIQPDLAVLGLPLWLAAFGAAVTLLVGRMRGSNSAIALAMVLWWIAAACLALLGPSRSMRYWQATFPPLVILGAVAFFHLEEMYRRLNRGYREALVLLAVTGVIWLGRPLYEAYSYGVAQSYEAYRSDPNERQELKELGNRVQELVPAGERIYVWGYRAGVYVHADRRPASRFTYPRSKEQMNEILADLAARKAYAILIPEEGAPEFERRWCDEDCHLKRAQVLTGYTEGDAVDGLRVWKRNDAAESR
jgi:hypothetical protein